MATAMRTLLHPPSQPFLLCNSKLAAASAGCFPPRSHASFSFFSHRRSCLASTRCQVTALQPSKYTVKEEGKAETLEHRVFFFDTAGKKVSPWHDIPLHAGDGLLNFVVEIPKESSAKMEVATEECFTPIKQDTKKGKLRFYPYNINWNYGLLPQTWEDPSHSNVEVEGAFGDNDPVDVVEIGERRAEIGEVLKVKPLAVLAMIDEGELDWKIIAISADDPKASLVNDTNDVEEHFPGTLTAIRVWFRDYKIPDGKPANKFGLGNKAAGKASRYQGRCRGRIWIRVTVPEQSLCGYTWHRTWCSTGGAYQTWRGHGSMCKASWATWTSWYGVEDAGIMEVGALWLLGSLLAAHGPPKWGSPWDSQSFGSPGLEGAALYGAVLPWPANRWAQQPVGLLPAARPALLAINSGSQALGHTRPAAKGHPTSSQALRLSPTSNNGVKTQHIQHYSAVVGCFPGTDQH